MKKELLGYGSSILNALIFIYILLNITKDCFNTFQMSLTAFGLIISFLTQIASETKEADIPKE